MVQSNYVHIVPALSAHHFIGQKFPSQIPNQHIKLRCADIHYHSWIIRSEAWWRRSNWQSNCYSAGSHSWAAEMWCIMPLNSAEINKDKALTPVIPQSLVSTQKKKQSQRQSLHLWCILLKCSYTKDFVIFSFLPGFIGNYIIKISLSVFPFFAVVVEGFSSRSYFTSTSSLLSFYTNSIAKVTSVRGGAFLAAVQCPCVFCLCGVGVTTNRVRPYWSLDPRLRTTNFTKLEYILLAQFVQQTVIWKTSTYNLLSQTQYTWGQSVNYGSVQMIHFQDGREEERTPLLERHRPQWKCRCEER